ncbi:hypothetical protein pmac_cds_841 [Pandoravirus macleodensis]|uniref:Uncharacterized protein n=1 Tax=Pandoravirus macleodensis TaxID=2107707 RepID=A0A2U7UG87_9VIRU|nr:hypothetical protein pmac_cds_841 [Pandoravirus macleodensis]AVK77529.1 hypothetical protein pmac_cds_841 [Pandoravirus macleodensis]
MFWRRRGRRAPNPPATAPLPDGGRDKGATLTPTPSHSYDDADYWERERLNPWGPAQRAEEQRWTRRRTEDADRARAVADAVRTAGQCDVAVDAAAVTYAAGFLLGVGLVTPAEFDARVDRAVRFVMAVGDARVPVAFDARDVVRSLTAAGVGNGVGLFQSDLVTCLMGEADTARVRALAKAASDREIARLLFQTPRVKPMLDAYGVWGLAPAYHVNDNDGRGSWVRPEGTTSHSPSLRVGGGPTHPTRGGSPWDHYVDMYGSADDIYDQENGPSKYTGGRLYSIYDDDGDDDDDDDRENGYDDTGI